MGYRMHVCKKYDVEYGDGMFNRMYDCINEILEEFCPNVYFTHNESSDVIEVQKLDFRRFLANITNEKANVIEIIKRFVKSGLNTEEIENIDKYCNNMYIYILNGFIQALNQTNGKMESVRFEWF